MRDALIEELYKKMHTDERIFFLSADFGSPVLDKLRDRFKGRFINVGIAEQNLINISTGLALEGFTVYAYAISAFITMRAYEQIRTNLALHSKTRELNVNLIGVGAGLSYNVSGPTHHCLEDISIMRVFPNFTVFSPSDWVLLERFVDYTTAVKSPKYLRLEGKPVEGIYGEGDKFRFEHGFHELIPGSAICLVSTGYMTHVALKVAREFRDKGVDIGVIDVFMLKPLDEERLYGALRNYGRVITLEEAFINCGGLDSLVTAVLNDNGAGIKVKRLGFKEYIFDIGSRERLHGISGLDEKSISKCVEECLLNK